MATAFSPNSLTLLPSIPNLRLNHRVTFIQLKPLHCVPIHQQVDADADAECSPCNGKGWLLCDFCKGQKTNVKSDNKRLYRRCPSCRAVGYVLCPSCKVFKCVTFPNFSDAQSSSST